MGAADVRGNRGNWLRGAGPALRGLLQRPCARRALWTGGRWCEGPAWFAAGRYLVWSDIPTTGMMRYDETDGSVSVFRSPRTIPTAIRWPQGRLVTCEHLTRRVTRTEHDGAVTRDRRPVRGHSPQFTQRRGGEIGWLDLVHRSALRHHDRL